MDDQRSCLSLFSATICQAATPTLVSLSPTSGTGNAQTFTATYSDSAGIKNLNGVRLLVNKVINGANSISTGTNPCGSLSGAVYTPPASLAAGSTGTFTLTGTAGADNASTINLWPTIISVDSSSISRLDIGSPNSTQDSTTSANWWTKDVGAYGESIINAPPNATGNTAYPAYINGFPDALFLQIGTYAVSEGDDFHYYEVVPNGNYYVTVYETEPNCPDIPGVGILACGTWPLSSGRGLLDLTPLVINVNGVTVQNAWDWSYPGNYLYAKDGSISVPATVTNNFLDVGVYPLAPDITFQDGASPGSGSLGFSVLSPYKGVNLGATIGSKVQFISAIQIAPTTAGPSLAIDAARNVVNNNAIAPGGSSQPFYAIPNFFIGGITSWSVTRNNSELTASLGPTAWGDGGEILTLGAGSAPAGQPIIVTATNGGYSASITFQTTGSSYLLPGHD